MNSAAADTEIVLVGPGTSADAGTVELRRLAHQLLGQALAADLRDDRFDGDWPPDDLVAAVEIVRGRPVGYLGGAVDRGRLQLAGLIDEGHPIPSGSNDASDAAVADRTADGAQGPDRPPSPVDETAERLWAALEPTVLSSPADAVELWAHPARPWHQRLAAANGLSEARALHQLRCTLPITVDVEPVASRSFDPGRDVEALLRVNNRAFAAHPDQGGMTRATIDAAAAEPWFDADGIRLLDDPDRPGVLAGFCWTKIHEPSGDGQPRLGEIYAIGIDPDHHGRGLGVPMTAAGLAWLADQGLTTGMLYVEADNAPALRTYDKLGFRHHRTDRAWRRDLGR